LIKQIGDYDCLLACLANFMERPIKDLFSEELQESIKENKGAYGNHIDAAFNELGMKRGINFTSVHIPSTQSGTPLVKALLSHRKAIIQVPSLNYENGSHFVYWDGYNIKDPSNKQTYKWISQCLIEGVIVLN
jgi:hypothetical protein